MMKKLGRLFCFVFLLTGMHALAAAQIPRPEYPRPDFVRDPWVSLNGTWEFQFDDRNVGLSEKWYSQKKPFEKTILVPYCFQSKRSGIEDTAFHDVFWYRRSLNLPAERKAKRIRLHFGAVDYRCQVWVNGELSGGHDPTYRQGHPVRHQDD